MPAHQDNVMKNSIKQLYGFSEKWSPEIEDYGFTQVPNLLLACQGHLTLKDGELTTLLQLLTFWFDHNGRVYPSISTLTRFSSKGYSTVQKRLCELERKGFVTRHRTKGSSNTYNLLPCVLRLYNHQKVCHSLPRKRSQIKVKTMHKPTSYISNKQYQPKRQNNKNKVTPVSSIISERYGDLQWPNR